MAQRYSVELAWAIEVVRYRQVTFLGTYVEAVFPEAFSNLPPVSLPCRMSQGIYDMHVKCPVIFIFSPGDGIEVD